MQAINNSYLADADSGIRSYIRYAIFVGRNIEIVFKRSRQGLLRFENRSVPPGNRIGSLLCLSFCAIPSAYSRMYWAEGMAGLFLKHTLQVPLGVT